MLIFGGILCIIGFLLCLTIIGSVIGIPLIVIGSILMFIGMFGRRKTIITNVVQVSNAPYPTSGAPPAQKPETSDTVSM